MSQTSQDSKCSKQAYKQSSAGSEEQVASLEDLDVVASRFDEVLENVVRHVSQYRAVNVVFLKLLDILREADGLKPRSDLFDCPLSWKLLCKATLIRYVVAIMEKTITITCHLRCA